MSDGETAESARPEDTAVDRRTRVSIVASLIVHVLGALLFALLFPFFAALQPPQPKAPAEVVTERLELEKKLPLPPKPRTVTHVAAAPKTPAPQPRVTAHPIVRALPQRHELAKIVPHAPLTLPQTRVAPQRLAPPAAVVRGKPHLTDQQIAKIQDDLGDAIKKDREGIDPLKVPAPETTPSMKHYGHDFTQLALGSGAHGLCDPVQSWKEGSWNYYYVACNVQFDDGSFQRQGVPWPVRFAAASDPFAGTAQRNLPLAMPLPGWHLGPGESISPQLRDYAHDHGVDL